MHFIYKTITICIATMTNLQIFETLIISSQRTPRFFRTQKQIYRTGALPWNSYEAGTKKWYAILCPKNLIYMYYESCSFRLWLLPRVVTTPTPIRSSRLVDPQWSQHAAYRVLLNIIFGRRNQELPSDSPTCNEKNCNWKKMVFPVAIFIHCPC